MGQIDLLLRRLHALDLEKELLPSAESTPDEEEEDQSSEEEDVEGELDPKGNCDKTLSCCLTLYKMSLDSRRQDWQ